MGKAGTAAAAEPPPPAKKSRPLHSPNPSKSIKHQPLRSPDLNSNLKTPNSIHSDPGIRRSTRRNPVLESLFPSQNYSEDEEEEEEEEEEDERELKKRKLVQRLPADPQINHQNSRSSEKLQSRLDNNRIEMQEQRPESETDDGRESVRRATDAAASRALDEESGPTPLPDKKTILFILDRLQKKDTHGAFCDPVDPEELPDYHEIIEKPMDFATVRKKLDTGMYQNLEQFEEDIFLICSNAMEYNAPSTVYYRKARAIQELAKRDFDNLRQKGEDGAPQPRVIRRGRPPRAVEKSPKQPLPQIPSSEFPNTAIATIYKNSKTYNLRKGLSVNKYVTEEALLMGTDDVSCNGGTNSSMQEWNNEFPASILRASYGKKPMIIDETRRDTYMQQLASSEMPVTHMLMTEAKRLLPVGIGMHDHYAYVSSLARFASGLGPVAWHIAMKKIRQSLPPGSDFNPSHCVHDKLKFRVYELDSNLRPIIPGAGPSNDVSLQKSLPSEEACMEAAGKLRSQHNWAHTNGSVRDVTAGSSSGFGHSPSSSNHHWQMKPAAFGAQPEP